MGRLETIAEFPEGEVAITDFSRVGEIEDPSYQGVDGSMTGESSGSNLLASAWVEYYVKSETTVAVVCVVPNCGVVINAELRAPRVGKSNLPTR